MKMFRALAIATFVLALMGVAGAQTWAPIAHQPTFNVGPVFVLRDGRILAHEEQSGDATAWHCFTPDATGSYANGQWSDCGHFPASYAPFYFGSNVRFDGKTFVAEGGEYNMGSAVWTTLGAVGTTSGFGNPFTWTLNSPPSGWGTIGDAQAVTLANGDYLQANCCTKQTALYNGPNSWTPSGSVQAIRNDESGYTLLQNDKVLMVDVQTNNNCGSGNNKSSEFYTSGAVGQPGTWACGPQLHDQLWQQSDQELGAAVLMYNNKVIQFGGNVSKTNIYDAASNTWAAGPTPSGGLQQADGPAALEPNGKVLAMLSPGLFQSGCQMVEYNPATGTLSNTANPSGCPSDSSFVGHLLTLPNGQVMFTDFSNTVELYTPVAGVAANAVPVITSTQTVFVNGSSNNSLTVTNLNGLSQASAYGDDYVPESDYPLVRLKSVTTGNVTYARTHDESTHSIAQGTSGKTHFDLPKLSGLGQYNLFVVVNGIPSAPFPVTIAHQ